MKSFYKYHEEESFQNFMSSSERGYFLNDEVYDFFFSYFKDQDTILDFGCGQGYVSLLYGKKVEEENMNIHIYACDYQEPLLDFFWKNIVSQKVKNVTPFFLANQDKAIFPNWVPKPNHIVFSFSLSTVTNIKKIFVDLKEFAHEHCKFHIVEWNPKFEDPVLEKFFPKNKRIAFDSMLQTLQELGYQIEKSFKANKKSKNAHSFYAFTAHRI